MFGSIDDPAVLDRAVTALAWSALAIALAGLVAGVLGFLLSAPLYLASVVIVAVGGVALRRRHELASPVEHPQYRDLVVSLTLGTLVLAGLVATIEALGLMARFDLFQFTIDAASVIVLAQIVLTLGIGLLAGALVAGLRLGDLVDRPVPGWARGLLLALGAAFLLVAVPVGLGLFEGTFWSRTRFEWVFYAGAGLLGAQLFAILQLGLPGPAAIAERINDRFDLTSRKRLSLVVLGVLAGFYALLWFLIHLTLSPVLEVALPGIDPLTLIVPAILVPEVALVFLTVRELRRREDKPFYDRSMKLTVLGISAGLAGIFTVLLLTTRSLDYLILVILTVTGPYGFYEFARVKHLRKMEEKLPDLLRDLAEYWKGGLSMTDAIDTLAKGEYGELTPEVRKMAVQLSWGVRFDEVLRMFAERVNTQLVHRAVSLIREADRAGGKISDILMAAANDAREIKWLEKERSANMGIYVAIIYMSFGVFLAVILIIVVQFLPAIVGATESLGGATTIGNVQIRQVDKGFITLVFFASAIVQSIGSGMVGGVMGEGEPSAGMKHVFIMVLISYLTFRLLVGI